MAVSLVHCPRRSRCGPLAAWQKASGYNWRALVEADMSRFKRLIGDRLRLRTARRQATEVAIAATALNRMLELGRLKYICIP